MEEWSKIFYYDETSPSCLRWGIKSAQKMQIGDIAGSLDNQDYYRVHYRKNKYQCHRVVWELFNGVIEEHSQIDHINGLRTDNRISNLRLVTRIQNMQNQKKYSNNTSGITGVNLDLNSNAWRARWCSLNGERMSKTFSINKYGYDLAFKLACDYRIKMIQELNLNGCDYTDRHGT